MTKATIKDVAKLANVSLKTVSRVINNEPTVRAAKVKLVQDAIQKLGYKPNLAARNLRSSKGYALGLVYDNPNPYYIIDMQNGALSICREMGYGLQIHPCRSDALSIADNLVQLVKNNDLSGLVIAPPVSERADIIAVLKANNIHFVGIVSGSEEDKTLSPCMCVDDRSASRIITEHIISEGHSEIAFFWGEEVHKSSPERYKGYVDALQTHGIALNEALILQGQYSFDSGYVNAQKILALKHRPTAIVCSNDEIAAGAMAAIKSAGLSVPTDIAISGFEDSPFSRHSSPPMTTAKQATETIAASATKFLINKIRPISQEERGEETVMIFSPELIVRQSTLSPSP